MIPVLVGMFDSPFVRRVAVTMNIYGMPFEHRNWSVFSDSDSVSQMNPLGRVPALILKDNETLVESAAIIDYLDEMAGPGRALLPGSGPERRVILRRLSTAMGACEKAVAIVYETQKREQRFQDPAWLQRLQGQLTRAAGWLESEIPAFSSTLDQSQITTAVTVRFVQEYLPGLAKVMSWPRLTRLSHECEETEAFQGAPFYPR